LRKLIESGGGYTPAWKGRIRGKETAIVPVTMYTYFIIGLAEKPLFMGQVELAKRLGMENDFILANLIKAQDQWIIDIKGNSSLYGSFINNSSRNEKDILIQWLEKT